MATEMQYHTDPKSGNKLSSLGFGCMRFPRSAALCERVGMTKEGRLRENRMVNGIYYDTYCFAILKRESSAL